MRARTEPAPQEPGPTAPKPQGVPDGGQREALAGLVERVDFHAPESGFYALQVRVRGRRDPVTVVDTKGEFVQASAVSAPTRS